MIDILKKIVVQFQDTYEMVIFFFPGSFGSTLRRRWVEKKCKKVGVRCNIDLGMRLESPENIEIGYNANIDRFAFLQASKSIIKIGNDLNLNINSFMVSGPGGEIHIGDNVIIGPNVVMRAVDHNYENLDEPIQKQGHISGKIIIEDDVWIGANVVITKDVTIGKHSIVAAGSVVTKTIEPFSIVGGVPAKLINKRTG